MAANAEIRRLQPRPAHKLEKHADLVDISAGLLALASAIALALSLARPQPSDKRDLTSGRSPEPKPLLASTAVTSEAALRDLATNRAPAYIPSPESVEEAPVAAQNLE